MKDDNNLGWAPPASPDRAASLRPQPAARSSRSGIDWRGALHDYRGLFWIALVAALVLFA